MTNYIISGSNTTLSEFTPKTPRYIPFVMLDGSGGNITLPTDASGIGPFVGGTVTTDDTLLQVIVVNSSRFVDVTQLFSISANNTLTQLSDVAAGIASNISFVGSGALAIVI